MFTWPTEKEVSFLVFESDIQNDFAIEFILS